MTYRQGCRAAIENDDVSRQRKQLPLVLTETQYIAKGRGRVSLPTPYSTMLVGNNCMLGVYDPSPYDDISTFYVVMREVSRQPPLLLLKLVYPLLYDGAVGLRLAPRNPRYYQKKQTKTKRQKHKKRKNEEHQAPEDDKGENEHMETMEEEEGIVLEWRGCTTMAAELMPFSLTLTRLIPNNNSKNENDPEQQTLRNVLSTIPPIMRFPYVFGVEAEDSEVLAYVEAEAESQDGVTKLWGFLRKRGRDRVVQETNEEIRRLNQQQKQRKPRAQLKEDHLEEEELGTWMLVLVAPQDDEDKGGDRLLVAEVRGNQLFGVWNERDCFALHLTTATSDNT
ncbi:hypothetical protein QOT17_023247 [Balamuthia mandrillaris]